VVYPAPRVAVETWLGAPALSYPDRPASVAHLFDDAVRAHGDRPLFVQPDGTVTTYDAFARLVAGAVGLLAAEGVRPGETFAVAARNGLELAVAQFAAASSGTVLAGLNVKQAPAQWDHAVDQLGIRVGFAQPGFPLRTARTLPAAALLAHTAEHRPPDALDEASTYAVVHTSGSTGRSKASQVVHRASVHSAMTYAAALQMHAGDVSAVLFPLYYISAMHAHVLPSMLVGARCLLLADPAPAELAAAVRRHAVTWAYAVPAYWRLLLRAPGAVELLEGLDRLGTGGAAYPTDLLPVLRERLPRTRLYDVYGLSETHSPATLLADEDLRGGHVGSVGKALPCMEARIDGADGPDQPGELLLRGSLVTTGYAGDPAATRSAIDTDGWFRTGDVASIDAQGYVTVLDRVKDMVNRGGHKVFSAEVERVLREHPGVADVAVVAGPDRLAGEAVIAFVVAADPAAPPPAADLRRLVTAGLADYAAPRHVHVLDELPRTATGKVDKLELRRRAARPAGPAAPAV